MAHGGKREGAGKPKGATAKRTQEAVEKALAIGITPLEVMLMAMKDSLDKGELKEASNFAKDAAPYCHAKLQATTIKNAEGETFRTSAAMLPPALLKALDDAIISKY